MEPHALASSLAALAAEQGRLAEAAARLAQQAAALTSSGGGLESGGFFVTGLTIFVLACFVGYHVVWRVTPALHSPLMAVTNAVSSVIIVGALLAAGAREGGAAAALGLVAVFLASVNIFGGFLVTRRMLEMFKKKERPAQADKASAATK